MTTSIILESCPATDLAIRLAAEHERLMRDEIAACAVVIVPPELHAQQPRSGDVLARVYAPLLNRLR